MAVLIKVIVLCFEQQGRRRQRYIHLVTVTPVLTSIGIINDVRHSRYFLVFRCMQYPFRHPTRLFFLSSELADGVIILRYLQTFSRSLFTISTNKRTKYFILPLPSQSRSEVSWIGFLTLDKFAHPSTTQENVLFSLLWLDAHLTSFSRISLGRNSRVFAKHKLLCTFLYYILLPSHVFGTAVLFLEFLSRWVCGVGVIKFYIRLVAFIFSVAWVRIERLFQKLKKTIVFYKFTRYDVLFITFYIFIPAVLKTTTAKKFNNTKKNFIHSHSRTHFYT